MIVAGVMQARTPEGMDENSPVTILIGLAIIGLLLLDLLAIGFGVVGLLQRNTKKVFAILGIVFAALTLLGTIALIIFGNARMSAQQAESFSQRDSGRVAGDRLVMCHFNLSALPITTKSDTPIASAHKTGLMKPNAASGTPTAL